MAKKNRGRSRAEQAASIRREQARRERRTTLIAGAAVAAVVLAIIGFAVISSLSHSRGPTGAAGPMPPLTVKDGVLYAGEDPDATLKVVVYEDFLCPVCRQFEEATRKSLRQAAKDGRAYVEYRPFHLLDDDYSARALTAYGAVLENGTPQQALRFHDYLYDHQPYENAGDKPDAGELADWARKVDASDPAITRSIRDPGTSFYDSSQKAAQGVEGTPTVLVNGKQLTGRSVEQVIDQLEDAIKSAS